MRWNLFLGLSLILTLSLSGCSRLVDERTKELSPGELYNQIQIPPQKSPMKLEIKIDSTVPLRACIYAEKKADAAERDLFSKKQPADAIAYQADQSKFTLTGTLPADETGILSLQNIGTQKGTIKVNIRGY